MLGAELRICPKCGRPYFCKRDEVRWRVGGRCQYCIQGRQRKKLKRGENRIVF